MSEVVEHLKQIEMTLKFILFILTLILVRTQK